ncbi:hypothetical protein SGRA_1785 [Saprospira grandis str. Lewin]|uniref:Uncharacterized protein n=1 Tax=Saprospira grandis (strain Lewin) TaxID=984262 RepID=H6KZD0_SAPGL|nr:hypothetical protein SGRA_1785 [Saprospira grandis str. Lewin]
MNTDKTEKEGQNGRNKFVFHRIVSAYKLKTIKTQNKLQLFLKT